MATRSTLYRGWASPVPLTWLSENEFVGTIERRGETYACYGWSKGAGFMIYSVDSGHIEKLGVVPRETLAQN